MDASWEDLPRNKIAFVTFNYDRSLEHYLATAFEHKYGKSREEALAMVVNFPIVHVYGMLGPLDPKIEGHMPYGVGTRPEARYHAVARAASGLQVIAEGRDDSPALQRARELINAADALCFLGFGFDSTNVARLGGVAIRAGGPLNAVGDWSPRRFAATAYGMTVAERHSATSAISNSSAFKMVLAAMHDLKCLATLRETLILSKP